MITKTIMIALTAILMLGVLAPLAFAEDAVVTDDTANLSCSTDKTCQDEHQSCYYKCIENTCTQIATLVALQPYPDCSEKPSPDTSAETEAELEMNEDVSSGKVAWKQLQLWLTFKQEKKVDRELDLARLRLIQAKIAAKNGDSEAMEKALEAHEKIMDRVQKRVKAIELAADGKNITAPVAKLVALETAIVVHERRITFLNNVLANANLTDEQRAKVEARINHVEEVTAKLEELNQDKRENIVTKLMAVSDMTEKEANTAISAREATIRAGIKEKIQNKLANTASDAE